MSPPKNPVKSPPKISTSARMRRLREALREPRRAVPAAAAGLAVLLVLVACSINPATGERQLTLLSERQEIALGVESDQEIVASLGVYPDDELEAYVAGLGHRLAALSERPDLDWTFRVVDDPVVNAFALPGGYIYITRGILAHLDSEAELAAVLGHEIGHVTARHSVEQLSKIQLAQIGLGVGALVSESFSEMAGLAEQGLGVLFLKFSRDDERQADELGLRYLHRAGYDPRRMTGVFEALERVSRRHAGSGRLPGWLSTHPTPENRIERIEARVASLAFDPATAVVGRERYLRRLDGLVFGQDPREGFFDGRAFYHPGLAFELRFPEGWKTSNQKQSVSAESPGGDAIVNLTLADADTAAAAAEKFFRPAGVVEGSRLRLSFDGPSVASSFTATTGGVNIAGAAVFVEHGDRVFRLLGFCREERLRTYGGTLESSVGSFREVSDPRVFNVEPKRLELVELERAMSVEDFARRYRSTVDAETLALLNGVDAAGAILPAGSLAKRVVGGELPRL